MSGLKNFCVSTVALPNTSEVSFTMVPADFDVATFSVTLPKNSPVSVIAPLIDWDASSCVDVVVAGVEVAMVVWFVVEFVWLSTESNVHRAVNMTTKINKITMVVGILVPIFIVRIYQYIIIFNFISFHLKQQGSRYSPLQTKNHENNKFHGNCYYTFIFALVK